MCRKRKKSIDYSGMTVNERLFISGQLFEFETALRSNNEEKAKDILRSLSVSEKDVVQIIKSRIKQKQD